MNSTILSVTLCAVCAAITCAYVNSMHLLVEEIKNDFDIQYSHVAFLPAITLALANAGIIATITIRILGVRKAVIFAGLISSASQLLSAWMHSYAVFVFLFGVVNGLCFCITLLAPFLVIGHSLEKSKQHLAFAALSLSIGTGLCAAPLLFDYLLTEYCFRGTIVITAGIILQLVVCGAGFPVRLPDCNPTISARRWYHYFQFELFSNYRFLGMCGAAVTLSMVNAVMSTFNFSILLSYSAQSSIDHVLGSESSNTDQVLNLLAFSGIASIVGRLPVFLCKESSRCPRWIVWCVSAMVMAICIILIGFLDHLNYAWVAASQLIYTASVGFAYGLHPVIISDVMETKDFGITCSYNYMFMAMGAFLAPPVAGKFRDVFNSFRIPLVLFGCILLITFLSPCVAFIMSKIVNQRRSFLAVPDDHDDIK